MNRKKKIYFVFKSIIDFIFALMLLILILPLMIVLVLISVFVFKGRPFLLQKRYGRNQKIFTIIKLRSMKLNAPKDEAIFKISHPEHYLNKYGRFLRRSGFDELPQLLNVLFFQMSFIGPRPVVIKENELVLLREEKGVNCLRPGISGYAQVKNRGTTDYETKSNLDKFYLDHFSLLMDIKVFCLTFARLFK